MPLPKPERARCIMGAVFAMLRNKHGSTLDTMKPGDILSVEEQGHWSAQVTRRSSTAEAYRAHVPQAEWDLFHVHVGARLVLALRFHGYDCELIRFDPGEWERWFGMYEPFDLERFPSE